MNINILGGGWVTALDFGQLDDGNKPTLLKGQPVVPPAKEIFSQPLTRYGRFDTYTKLGCAAIALALKDAQLDQDVEKRPIGLIVSTVYECFESDIAYYDTTKEEDGFYASPNLFSYTLPGIVIGEAAIHFKCTGPTFTVGDTVENRGYNAINTALNILNSGACDTIVAGWLDSPIEKIKKLVISDDKIRGAIFVVLSKNIKGDKNKTISQLDSQIYLNSNKKVKSILDLF